MNRNFAITTITMLLALMFTACAYANSFGVSYSQIIEDRSLGVTGDYETQLSDRVKFEADAQGQAGDVYSAIINTDFTFDISAVDLKLLVQNKLKGYELASLGREQSVSLAFTVPVDSLNFDVGVGGQNANPFGSPSAFDTLAAAGFAEDDISGKGLESLSPAPQGIPIQDGSALNAFVATGFSKGIFDIDLKGAIQLVSEDDKMHQVNTRLKTSGKLGRINLTTALEIGLASYRESIHYELATVTTAGIDF